MPHNQNRLSLAEKLGYALGDAGANFVLQIQIVFLMYFYTDVYGIAASVIAVLMVGCRAIDACNDLVVGVLADRTLTRWGRFRPWIALSSVPLGLTAFLVFAAPELQPTGKIIWAAVTLALMIVAYGANNVPYSALGGVISDDPNERVSVAAWRFNFANTAALLVQTFTLPMIAFFGAGNEQHGYRVVVAIWALLAAICSFGTFLSTRERVLTATPHSTALREDLAALWANRSWRVLALTSLVIYISLGMRGNAMLYYFDYTLQRKDLFGAFSATGIVAAIVGIHFSRALVDRWGKRNVFGAGLVLSGLLSAAYHLLRGEQPAWLFGLHFAFQFVFGATGPVLWGMIADVADLTEWHTRRRITALTFAATLFCFKIGQGIGAGITGWLLSAMGYEPNVTQTASVIEGIRLMISMIPAGLFLASSLVIQWYEVTKELEEEMTAALRGRRVQPTTT